MFGLSPNRESISSMLKGGAAHGPPPVLGFFLSSRNALPGYKTIIIIMILSKI